MTCARDLRSRRRHGRAGAAELQRREQHLHGGEIAGVAGAIDLDDQPRHAREIARAFLDELHARQLGERDGVGNRHVGAGAGIEIERDRQLGLARRSPRNRRSDRPASAARRTDAAAPAAAPRRRPAARRQWASSTAVLNEGCEMPTITGTRPLDELDRLADQGLALLEAEIGVFLGLDAGGDHHGGAAVVDDVVDLRAEARARRPRDRR